MYESDVKEFLIKNDLEPTAENIQQLYVFLEAMHVYQSRAEAYGQVWKQYGALSNLLSAARKVDRLMEQFWFHHKVIHKDALDDAKDLLNYTAFFVRNARLNNITGKQAIRPASG